MSRIASRVYSDAADLARLEALAVQLPQDGRVVVVLDDNSVVQGIVTTTPTLQMFFDPQDNEGLNGVVRIEGLPGGSGDHYLWLDRIQSVTPLPNPSPPEASSRIHPPDPNAPARE